MKSALTLSITALLGFGSFAQCGIDIVDDTTTIYLGYAPLACTDLVTMSTGTAPFAYAWSSGDTTDAINVCDTASTWYYVTLTDSTGCTWTDSSFVNVVDVRCGNNPNNQKVLVCHVPPGNPANEHTICISENAVSAHLAHGCYLGTCDSDTAMVGPSPNSLQVFVSPNPVLADAWVTVTSTHSTTVDMILLDAMGREILSRSNIAVSSSVASDFPLDVSHLSGTIRMVHLVFTSTDGDQVRKTLVIGK